MIFAKSARTFLPHSGAARVNIIIREPGHVEYASTLGLGVYDRTRITLHDMTV